MELDADVLIVGGGLTGLTCAVTLSRQGFTCRILEGSDAIGGCIRTDRIDGFLLDRGFQVLSTAYPETQRLLDFSVLGLQKFSPGALVWYGGRFRRVADPFRQPRVGLTSAFQPIGTFLDKIRMGKLRYDLLHSTHPAFLANSNLTTMQYLQAYKFSEKMINRFFRPFLNGIFQDKDLKTSADKFLFVMKMFATGDAALPQNGMGAIPAQLAAQLPSETLQIGTPVASIQNNTLLLENGDRLTSRAVVVATEAHQARKLLPHIQFPPLTWKSVTCLYYSAPHPPISGSNLILNGEQEGIVNNLCVLSEVAPTYSSNGESLISVSLPERIGPERALDTEVRNHLTQWFGSEVKKWRLLKAYSIPQAQPLQEYGFQTGTSFGPALSPGLFLSGIHQEFATIEGAITSGRKTAQAIMAHGY